MKVQKLFHFLLQLVALAVICSCSKTNDPEPGASPSVVSISATSAAKDANIIITGTDLPTDLNRIKVTINGVSALIISVTSTSVTFKVPKFSPAPTSQIPIVVFADNMQIGSFNFTYLFTTILVSVTNGEVGYADGPFATAKIEQIIGITIDSSGNVYTAQFEKPRVRKITPDSVLSSMAGDGTWGHQDGPGAIAKFGGFDYCASDAAGNIYVAENQNLNPTGITFIRKIDPSKNVTTFAAYPTGATGHGIKVSKSGTIYVHSVDRIGKVSSSGVFTWLAISAANGDQDGPIGTAKFRLNGGIEVSDDETKIYVSDNYNGSIGNKVKIFDVNTNTVTTIAGKIGVADGEGDALNVGFRYIGSTLLDNTGGLYIADAGNNKIKYLKNGQVKTIIGALGGGDIDGAFANAKILYPLGLAMNKNGEIFISCANNNKLKKITTE